MKILDNKILDFLIASCESEEIEISENQAEKLIRYLEMLVEWNEKVNLTAITEPKDVIIKHFIDSLYLLKTVDIPQNSSFIDVGTGAGFPGVVIKIVRPDIKMTLLDSLNKRLVFLKALGEELGLELDYIHMRAEDAGRDEELREQFDISCARAVAKLSVLSEYCIPLVKVGGKFVSMKGPKFDEELKAGQKAVTTLGAKLAKSETLYLPDLEKSERNISIFEKVKPTPEKYPRHGSKISKSPL